MLRQYQGKVATRLQDQTASLYELSDPGVSNRPHIHQVDHKALLTLG